RGHATGFQRLVQRSRTRLGKANDEQFHKAAPDFLALQCRKSLCSIPDASAIRRRRHHAIAIPSVTANLILRRAAFHAAGGWSAPDHRARSNAL
ncbi:MAG: hypothetical protein KKH54_13075, partial [Alphaproteobacteria bacterium]|nr:hypothetical protein [Alphaproteobacteria bacterium]